VIEIEWETKRRKKHTSDGKKMTKSRIEEKE
jgi:hypothetical protein